jgi:hypothetical protein
LPHENSCNYNHLVTSRDSNFSGHRDAQRKISPVAKNPARWAAALPQRALIPPALDARKTSVPYEWVMLPFPPRVLKKDYLQINPLGDGSMRMTEPAAICQCPKLHPCARKQTFRFRPFRSFRFPPVSVIRGGARPPGTSSKVGLLRQDQGVIDLNTEIADRAFELRVAEEQLARSGCQSSCRRAVPWSDANCGCRRRQDRARQCNPMVNEPAILPRCDGS